MVESRFEDLLLDIRPIHSLMIIGYGVAYGLTFMT